jgi:hypothetical protein
VAPQFRFVQYLRTCGQILIRLTRGALGHKNFRAVGGCQPRAHKRLSGVASAYEGHLASCEYDSPLEGQYR